MLDSSRPEPFVALCPHRLPLPPLLASQTPANQLAEGVKNASQQSSRPFARVALQPRPCLTAVDAPLVQSCELKTVYGDQNKDAGVFQTSFETYKACQPALQKPNMADLTQLQLACQRAQRPLAEALALWNAGVSLENAGLIYGSLRSFERFQYPCERAGYTPGVVTALSSQAVALFLLSEYKQAIERAEKGLQLLQDAQDVAQKTSGGWLSGNYIAASFLLNIGLCFIQLFDYEAATLALARALYHALQAQDSGCEAAVCAAQAVCNALSGDFQKVDSCLDRYVELNGIVETGLETTLGLKSLRFIQNQQVVQNVSSQVKQATFNACVCFLRIAALARVHEAFERARHFAQRAYNVGIVYQFQQCQYFAACAVGVCEAELDDAFAPGQCQIYGQNYLYQQESANGAYFATSTSRSQRQIAYPAEQTPRHWAEE